MNRASVDIAGCDTHAGWTEDDECPYCVSHSLQTRLGELESCIVVINELHNLNDAIYDVREREGERWEGPKVTAYGNALTKLRELLKEGGVSL